MGSCKSEWGPPALPSLLLAQCLSSPDHALHNEEAEEGNVGGAHHHSSGKEERECAGHGAGKLPAASWHWAWDR